MAPTRTDPGTDSRWLGIVFGLALAVRVLGITWGLPEVFEEAYPLKLAWRMWGLEGSPPSLNPGFFHYPSLVIHLEFIVLGAVRAILAWTGIASDPAALRTLFVVDPAPFYVPGRLLIALFGALTILPTWWLGRRAGGGPVAILAAILVAVNPALVRASQRIDVDVPLTCLVTAALAAIVGLASGDGARRLRQCALAGALVGLAASAKYPGILAAIPLAGVLIVRTGRPPSRERAIEWLVAGAALLLAFAATSPYFFLDAGTALRDLEAERVHLRLGHFGSESGASWAFYLRAWFASSLGWAVGAAAILGAIQFGLRRRNPWALVLLAFVLPLVAVLVGATLKADRYLLPVVPAAAILAAAWIGSATRAVLGRPVTVHAAIGLAIVCLATDFGRVMAHVRQLGPDSRTESRRWLEQHVPTGSMVVVEAYGPELPGPLKFMSGGIGTVGARAAEGGLPYYWVVPIPMFQVEPERSAVYYDPRLYSQADAWIVTGAVRDRYRADAARFPAQNAFYDWLAVHWDEAARIRLSTGGGSEIVIYRNPSQAVPFQLRVGSPPAPTRFMFDTGGADGEAAFYRNLGMNYIGFGRYAEAAEAFEIALRFPDSSGATRAQSLRGLRLSRQALLVPPGASADSTR